MGVSGAINTPGVSIGISIVFVIIAALFLLVDFDTIERCVENGVDKQYEWMAAWGLASNGASHLVISPVDLFSFKN
ncbi:Bax inhibitor-1/YccA family protein [uncultured Anaerovibrio sp.]|uniref:Bax inhibitor-1/YccA family membrane protein n=1 Tax=uncultured Anaerovibrio sp. TaxID=361586 RepID=UPI00342A8099